MRKSVVILIIFSHKKQWFQLKRSDLIGKCEVRLKRSLNWIKLRSNYCKKQFHRRLSFLKKHHDIFMSHLQKPWDRTMKLEIHSCFIHLYQAPSICLKFIEIQSKITNYFKKINRTNLFIYFILIEQRNMQIFDKIIFIIVKMIKINSFKIYNIFC